jgi:hypothetical protein
MNYTLLAYETPANFAARTDQQQKDPLFCAIGHYLKALKDAGVFVAGAGLQPPETATTFRYRDDKRQVQDGPYAETKEQLGGFIMIDVPNLDTALEWASRWPRMPGRVIEVRPNLPPLEH